MGGQSDLHRLRIMQQIVSCGRYRGDTAPLEAQWTMYKLLSLLSSLPEARDTLGQDEAGAISVSRKVKSD